MRTQLAVRLLVIIAGLLGYVIFVSPILPDPKQDSITVVAVSVGYGLGLFFLGDWIGRLVRKKQKN